MGQPSSSRRYETRSGSVLILWTGSGLAAYLGMLGNAECGVRSAEWRYVMRDAYEVMAGQFFF